MESAFEIEHWKFNIRWNQMVCSQYMCIYRTQQTVIVAGYDCSRNKRLAAVSRHANPIFTRNTQVMLCAPPPLPYFAWIHYVFMLVCWFFFWLLLYSTNWQFWIFIVMALVIHRCAYFTRVAVSVSSLNNPMLHHHLWWIIFHVGNCLLTNIEHTNDWQRRDFFFLIHFPFAWND